MNEYVRAVRELLEELNKESASGLITFRCAVLISSVDRQTRTLERRAERERDAEEAP
jgi:hypothetical protein